MLRTTLGDELNLLFAKKIVTRTCGVGETAPCYEASECNDFSYLNQDKKCI